MTHAVVVLGVRTAMSVTHWRTQIKTKGLMGRYGGDRQNCDQVSSRIFSSGHDTGV